MSEGMDELPGKPRAADDYPGFAEKLTCNPMRWYEWEWPLHSSNTSGVQNRIHKGVLKAFRPAGFYEARVREGQLYVRYVGENK